MPFNSYPYFLFLAVAVLGFRLLEKGAPTGRRLFLLLASYAFYAWWRADFLALLCGSTLVNFLIGRTIEQRRARGQDRRVERQTFDRFGGALEREHAVGGWRRRRFSPGGRFRRRRLRPLKYHPYGLTVELGAARHDRDVAGADHELAGFFERRPLRVTEIVQPIDQLAFGQRLTAPQFERPGEHARQHGRALAAQTLVARRSTAQPLMARRSPLGSADPSLRSARSG